jgi:undecaprenyl diphosphate synthase
MTVPRHVAVIMDGNGRWARRRGLPRPAGHKAGVAPVRHCVEQCLRHGVGALTLFAFSSENWARPAEEVGALMTLFLQALDNQVEELHGHGVRVRFIGDRAQLDDRLVARIQAAESLTAANPRLQLQIAVSYGGRWDLLQAAKALASRCAAGELDPARVTEEDLAAGLALACLPDPDLFIRTGGEQRISNFLLWNLAYTELYFTDLLWPEFDRAAFDAALAWFAARNRRFGLTGEQAEDRR